MSNGLDPEARRFVGPDLSPNCLQRLSADDTGRQRVTPKQNSENVFEEIDTRNDITKHFLYGFSNDTKTFPCIVYLL